MKWIVSVLAAALITAGSASAAPPGFWTNTRLAKAASWVAGKPVTVDCAFTQAAINKTVSATAADILGATPTIGDGEIYLAPVTCGYLDAWLNGRKPANLYGVAVSLETLAHEAELARGVADETSATCAGLKTLPQMVTRFFPLKKRESLHDVIGDAYRFWGTQSSVYHAHPC